MRAEIPETYKVPLVGSSSNSCMATAPPTRGPYLNINTQLANSLGTSPLSPAYMPGTPVYTPSMARFLTHWVLCSALRLNDHQAKLSLAAAGNLANLLAATASASIHSSWRACWSSTKPSLPPRLCHAGTPEYEQAPTAGKRVKSESGDNGSGKSNKK